MRSTNGEAPHTLRGLDGFNPNEMTDPHARLMGNNEEPYDPLQDGDDNGQHFPPILNHNGYNNTMGAPRNRFGSRKVPMYVKHAYPNVLSGNATGNLPKVPGAEDNYGMLYNKPETAAEKTMNELWLARRQQEAFQHKTQQQLAIVMDRLALHRSRLESDALRRQESETMLKAVQQAKRDAPPRSRKDPLLTDLDRPQSAADGRKIHGMSERLRDTPGSPLQSPDAKKAQQRYLQRRSPSPPPPSSHPTTLVVSGASEENMSATVAAPSRIAVPRAPSSTRNSIQSRTPMRFKIDLPPDYLQRQQYYMQLSDDEDDNDNDPHQQQQATNHQRSGMASAGGASNKPSTAKNNKRTGSAPNKAGEVLFKREKVEMRDRPRSAALFKKYVAHVHHVLCVIVVPRIVVVVSLLCIENRECRYFMIPIATVLTVFCVCDLPSKQHRRERFRIQSALSTYELSTYAANRCTTTMARSSGGTTETQIRNPCSRPRRRRRQ